MKDAAQRDLLARKFQKSDRMVTRRIADELVLVPLRGNVGELDNIFTLNETGAAAWEWLDGQASLRGVLDKIVSAYEVTEGEAAADLLELVEQLLEIGALEPA